MNYMKEALERTLKGLFGGGEQELSIRDFSDASNESVDVKVCHSLKINIEMDHL
jgi:hypothetical protein